MGRDDRRYLHQVRRALRGTGKQKKQVLAQVQSSVSEYREENPDCSYSDLVQRFGVPQQIAEATVSEMGAGEELDAMKVRQRILRMVSITAITVLILWAGVVGMAYLNHKSIDNGYAVVEIIEVTESTQ